MKPATSSAATARIPRRRWSHLYAPATTGSRRSTMSARSTPPAGRDPDDEADRLADDHAENHVAATRATTVSPWRTTSRIPGNGYRLSGADAGTGAHAVPMVPTSFTQARCSIFRKAVGTTGVLTSISVHWKTGFGELVSSTSFFSRKVLETEDESDFVYAEYHRGRGGEPQPAASSEEKDYQEFVEEVRFVSALQGPVQFVAGGFYSDFHGRLPFAAYYPPAMSPGLDSTLLGPGSGEVHPGLSGSDFHAGLSHRHQGARGVR